MGKILPRVDGAVPMDVTHPVWKQQMNWQIEHFIRWGFDYVKLDFLSHGAMEGVHYNPFCMTGRQGIMEGYLFLKEKLSYEKAGRHIFISLSIAPLFPYGFGHARRFSCDAFGLAEDTEYVLNALTYAWWQSGRLYAYNDPDHISLYRSFCADRNSLKGEARARYTVSVIAGTVMMLSDDYGIHTAKERARAFAGVRKINRLAAAGVSFLPVESAGASASCSFISKQEGIFYAALFYWGEGTKEVKLDLKRAGLPETCRIRELWTGQEQDSRNGALRWKFKGCDGALFEILEADPSMARKAMSKTSERG